MTRRPTAGAPLHIAQLTNFYGPQSGGIRICLDQLARQYASLGHRSTLVIPGPTNEVSELTIELDDGSTATRKVVQFRAPFIPGLGGYRGVIDVPKVLRALREAAPDVIELSDKTSLAAAAFRYRRRHQVPVVMISHERVDAVIASTLSDRQWVRSGVWHYNQGLLRNCDAVVCASQFAAAEFEPATPGQRRRVFKVPLGVDLSTFRPPAVAPPRDGPLRLVVVVRQSPEKDPWLIPATVRELVARGVDVEATVFGDGQLRAELAERHADLPLHYAGHTADRATLASEIAKAHVACAPGPNETFGLGALEILACGTPVVVPERGALKELITADCGRVAPSTGEAFADAVVDLAARDTATVRAAARARAERFTWQRTGREFVELFDDLRAMPLSESRVRPVGGPRLREISA